MKVELELFTSTKNNQIKNQGKPSFLWSPGNRSKEVEKKDLKKKTEEFLIDDTDTYVF